MNPRIALFSFIVAAMHILMLLTLKYVYMMAYVNHYVVLMTRLVSVETLSLNWSECLFFGATFLSALLCIRKRRWVLATTLLVSGILWVFLESTFFIYFKDLGVDSLAEAKDFDHQEAAFWFESFWASLRHFFNPFFLKGLSVKLLLYSAIGLISYLLLQKIRHLMGVGHRSASFIVSGFCIIAFCLSMYLRFEATVSLWNYNSGQLEQLWQNFSSPPPRMVHDQRDLTVVTYIGESTTVMNMGLYNAPENNMPILSDLQRSDPGFILFHQVFSTHSHTSSSLLEALSVTARVGEDYLPIIERHRFSMVDLLKAGGVNTLLLNNQGFTGSFNQTASVVFRNVDRRINSTNTLLVGNVQNAVKRPLDDVFFGMHLPALLSSSDAERRLIVLHSYAGHGPYQQYIPDSCQTKAGFFQNRWSLQALVGDQPATIQNIDDYDKSMRYIDYSISQVIEGVKAKREPAIFIYFSDHGESVFTGFGHNSSHFVHEMFRVPFILYFNPAARQKYPELYDKYRKLALQRHPATLAQLPSTIMELFGVRSAPENGPLQGLTPVVGAETRLIPVMVRKTASGTTYVELNDTAQYPHHHGEDIVAVNQTDNATRIFTLNNNKTNRDVKFCYHRSNTYAKAMRGSMVCDCLETDLLVLPDGSLALTHPPKSDVGFRLKDLFAIAAKNNMAVWIDGKNLNNPLHARKLLYFLKDSVGNPAGNLVEFPSFSHRANGALKGITDSLRHIGLATSYYVPTKMVQECNTALDSGATFENCSSCIKLKKDLEMALNSGMFTDFSFDYGGLRIMEMLTFTNTLRWNTWGIPEDSVRNMHSPRFRMVILSNDDPNNL